MKFATGELNSRKFVGLIIDDDKILDLQKAEKKLFELETIPGSLIECIQKGDKFVAHAGQLAEWAKKPNDESGSFMYALSDVTLCAPIPRPSKNVICIGKNYRDHAVEMGSEADIPEHPMVFTKAPAAVTGHGETVKSHLDVTEQLDYEGELAVIISNSGSHISKEHALDHIFGYTIVNDITARDLQKKHKQFFIGKSLDTTCPMGPVIVHKSAVSDPQSLKVETRVNGELRQSGSTGDMIFPIAELIETLSKGMTLEAGDIIATGTPSGVGKGFKPPKFLKPGDRIDITIEPIGTLSNQIG
ncbi:fumarylacetoacetate hydrolase family protein [Bacillus velezensis]|uniref:fumarylacetoacetate hydrolase family protein n=1 Tax=Bacillus TaxID=1386 RepID=UPI001592EB65|nr:MULTISPECIES: fumarylacetoacetate hydrolase family protein [Bacillus]MBT0953070.1 fumarylacetoacetate hydrolase family protein [Bacillus velezensis]MCQ9192024.1 fumarylacetoacetate hydrolase family protein [Bacillus velezensis]MCX2915084.1 fumarylacetoacetate hydrolase family protein [Bacillus velezensis]MCY6273978.1 fumarylacetoacetate hydrolase family protein [Bacillus sp. NEAU-16]MDA3607175.1 fumarylacetoacetate hydrolase family protein [Bacillus sp. NEAU-242-2]